MVDYNNVFYFNLKIGFIDMFRVLRLQNENKIAEFLTENFLGSKSNLTGKKGEKSRKLTL